VGWSSFRFGYLFIRLGGVSFALLIRLELAFFGAILAFFYLLFPPVKNMMLVSGRKTSSYLLV